MKRFKIINKRGFTLIELIVVLIIISISSSVLFLNIKNIHTVNGKKFTSLFVRLLQKSRVNSIVNDKTSILIIDPEKRKIYIKDNKKDYINIPQDITITAENIIEQDGKSYIYFYNNGSSTGMNINIYSEKFSKKIIVDKVTGFIKTMDIII